MPREETFLFVRLRRRTIPRAEKEKKDSFVSARLRRFYQIYLRGFVQPRSMEVSPYYGGEKLLPLNPRRSSF